MPADLLGKDCSSNYLKSKWGPGRLAASLSLWSRRNGFKEEAEAPCADPEVVFLRWSSTAGGKGGLSTPAGQTHLLSQCKVSTSMTDEKPEQDSPTPTSRVPTPTRGAVCDFAQPTPFPAPKFLHLQRTSRILAVLVWWAGKEPARWKRVNCRGCRIPVPFSTCSSLLHSPS